MLWGEHPIANPFQRVQIAGGDWIENNFMNDSLAPMPNSEEMAKGLEKLEKRVNQDKKLLRQTGLKVEELGNSISQMKQSQKNKREADK